MSNSTWRPPSSAWRTAVDRRAVAVAVHLGPLGELSRWRSSDRTSARRRSGSRRPPPRRAGCGRVVYETENITSGNSSIRRWHSVVLPAPDGDETTINRPRAESSMDLSAMLTPRSGSARATARPRPWRRPRAPPPLRRLRLGADGVDLAVELLREKVEPPPVGTVLVGEAACLGEVRGHAASAPR